MTDETEHAVSGAQERGAFEEAIIATGWALDEHLKRKGPDYVHYSMNLAYKCYKRGRADERTRQAALPVEQMPSKEYWDMLYRHKKFDPAAHLNKAVFPVEGDREERYSYAHATKEDAERQEVYDTHRFSGKSHSEAVSAMKGHPATC